MSEPECLWDLKAELGEGPVWDARDRSLYFVDIMARRIHRLTPATGERASWQAPSRTGFLFPAQSGGFVCGAADGLRRFDPASGRFGPLHAVEPMQPENRLNDGFVDDQGVLWFGSMHDGERLPTGSLYRLRGSPGVPPEAVDAGYVVSNGPTIDRRRGRLYHSDSALRRIYVFDLAADGCLSNRRLFAQPSDGYPDGMAVDAAGTLWVALFDGGCVRRYRPDGTADGAVPLPAAHVTKIAFGGDDLRTAYVTTARKGLDADTLARLPLSGGLFSFRVDVPGVGQTPMRDEVLDDHA